MFYRKCISIRVVACTFVQQQARHWPFRICWIDGNSLTFSLLSVCFWWPPPPTSFVCYLFEHNKRINEFSRRIVDRARAIGYGVRGFFLLSSTVCVFFFALSSLTFFLLVATVTAAVAAATCNLSTLIMHERVYRFSFSLWHICWMQLNRNYFYGQIQKQFLCLLVEHMKQSDTESTEAKATTKNHSAFFFFSFVRSLCNLFHLEPEQKL